MLTTYTLNLGTAKAGLTDLRAQFVNTDGTRNGAAIASGFVELGSGQYIFNYDLDSSFSGAVRFYSNATPSDVFVSVAINGVATAPAGGNADAVNAYLYTRDSSGVTTAGMVVSYQQLANTSGGAWDDDVHTATSDDDGLAQITMARGGTYKYWVGNGRFRTVTISNATADPYPLPAVTG